MTTRLEWLYRKIVFSAVALFYLLLSAFIALPVPGPDHAATFDKSFTLWHPALALFCLITMFGLLAFLEVGAEKERMEEAGRS